MENQLTSEIFGALPGCEKSSLTLLLAARTDRFGLKSLSVADGSNPKNRDLGLKLNHPTQPGLNPWKGFCSGQFLDNPEQVKLLLN